MIAIGGRGRHERGGMNNKNFQLTLDLIDAAYRAGSGNITWSNFLQILGNAFPELIFLIAGYDRRLSKAEVFASANIEEAAIQSYLGGYYKKNIYLTTAADWKILPNVSYCHELIDKSEVLKSEFYRDFIRPQGPYDEAFASVIFRDESRFLAVSANFSEMDRTAAHLAADVLGTIGPHIQRAFELYRQIEGKRIYGQALSKTLDHINSAVFLTELDGAIQFANKSGEILLQNERVLQRKNNILKFTSTSDQRAFEQEVTKLREYFPSHSPQLLRLEAPSGNEHIAFVSLFVDDVDQEELLDRNSIMVTHRLIVFVIDPTHSLIIDPDSIALAINCTNAEARLAASLVHGLDLKAHAIASGTSYNTCRAHLQSLFGKTGTNSQVELVRKLFRTFGFLQ